MLTVTIRCLVYNHEDYLRQCLDGFVMQKTTFRFEAIVHDDASTDGSAQIIREYEAAYPDIIHGIYETENQYSKRNGVLDRIMDSQMTGKYIAICEGDDYWTDPLKLQKEVDYLESHPECGLVFAKARAWEQKSGRFLPGDIGRAFSSFEELVFDNSVVSLTTMYRSNLYFSYIEEINPYNKGWKMADFPTWLYLVLHSSVHFIDEVVGVYRITEGSVSHGNYRQLLDIKQSACEISSFFASKYGYNALIPKIEDFNHRRMMHIAFVEHSYPDMKELFGKLHKKRWKDYLKMIISRMLSCNS